MIAKLWVVPLFSILALAACHDKRRLSPTVAEAVEGADTIDIVADSRQIRTFVGAARVRRAAERLVAFQDDWNVSGAPLPDIVLTIRKNGNPVATFGIGRNFLTTGPSQTWWRPLDDQQRSELLRLLFLEEKNPASDEVRR